MSSPINRIIEQLATIGRKLAPLFILALITVHFQFQLMTKPATIEPEVMTSLDLSFPPLLPSCRFILKNSKTVIADEMASSGVTPSLPLPVPSYAASNGTFKKPIGKKLIGASNHVYILAKHDFSHPLTLILSDQFLQSLVIVLSIAALLFLSAVCKFQVRLLLILYV